MRLLPFNRSKMVLNITCAALLSACATTGVAPMNVRALTIVAFGDSTTAPRVVDGASLRVYADILPEALEQRGISANVINAGVGGNDTGQARARFESDVLAHNPDIAIVQFGLNDSCIDVWDGKDRPRVTRETYLDNLRYFIETLHAQHCHVVLMTPNPMRWTEPLLKLYGKAPFDVSDPWGFNLTNHDYAQGVRDLAKELKVPLVDVYRQFYDYDAVATQSTDDLLLDGMHPNNAGHALIAHWLVTEIVK
jgi:lysophospholipase L1-like esterase